MEENMRIKTNDKYASILLKNMYENVKEETCLTAILNCVYTEKITNETINTKITNQLNSMEVSMHRINPKYNENSKNYDKIKEKMLETLNNYEVNLKQLCNAIDQKIYSLILKKVELESKLLMFAIYKEIVHKEKNEESSAKLEKEIRLLNKKINELNNQKINKVFDAMEERK
jgi:hypothetical protein